MIAGGDHDSFSFLGHPVGRRWRVQAARREHQPCVDRGGAGSDGDGDDAQASPSCRAGDLARARHGPAWPSTATSLSTDLLPVSTSRCRGSTTSCRWRRARSRRLARVLVISRCGGSSTSARRSGRWRARVVTCGAVFLCSVSTGRRDDGARPGFRRESQALWEPRCWCQARHQRVSARACCHLDGASIASPSCGELRPVRVRGRLREGPATPSAAATSTAAATSHTLPFA